MAVRLQHTLGEWVTLRRRRPDRPLRQPRHHPPRRPAPERPRAVRRGAGPARRHAHRHHPRLLPVPAAPLPARSRALPALPPGGRPRRRRRPDRGARGHARRRHHRNDAAPRSRCSPASPRPSSSAATWSPCRSDRRRLRRRAVPRPDLLAAQRRALGVTARTEADILAARCNWQAEPGLRRRRRASCTNSARKSVAERAQTHPGMARPGRGNPCRTLAAMVRRVPTTKVGPRACRRRLRQRQRSDQRAPTCQTSSWRRAAAHRGDACDACRALAMADLSAALLALAAPVLRAYDARKAGRRPGGLRRPDRPHLPACWSIPAPPGCSTSSTAAWTTCCWTRCRTPPRRNGTSPTR